jgi:phage terminase large subunit GpA-like protein
MLAKRQTNFPDKKLYRPSTPQMKETSTIEPAFETGTEERYYVPCPHCNPDGDHEGFMFFLVWDRIKYSKEVDKVTGYPVEVWCECPNCLGRIDEDQKTWMLSKGDWFTTKNNAGKRYKITEDPEIVSFQIPSFYSPYGFFSWTEAVQDWFKYQKTRDPALLQVFVNQTCAETFTLTGSDVSFNQLLKRRERYNVGDGGVDVPSMGLVLTAGVDVQKDRIEVETRAWGLYDETWGVDYAVFMGDTSQLGDDRGMLQSGQPSVWALLDQYLLKRWTHESGDYLTVEACMIDAQYRTEEVNIFCRGREDRRIFPVHGKHGWGKDYFSFNKKRHERYGTLNCTAYVDQLKSKVRSMLKINTYGPGFCHWPVKECYNEDYFTGLTCERLATKLVKGSPVLYWDNPAGMRNEPTDLFNYAYVARITYPIDLEARSRATSPKSESLERPVKRRRRGSVGLTG